MIYRLLADTLVLAHFLFIAFMALGGLFALRWRWFPWLHLPAAAWGVLVEWNNWYCPLTPLELRLRWISGERGYEGSFVEQYLLPIIYPAELTREIQVILVLLLLGSNLLAYLAVWRLRARRAAS